MECHIGDVLYVKGRDGCKVITSDHKRNEYLLLYFQKEQ